MIERDLQHTQLAAVIESYTPLKRAAEPDEVASAILYLCSPAASYVNGTSLVIDSGISPTLQIR
jgi:NAD(P)-dependent dehydrogenase (short-subunit alcohol dehydrogenase family)